MYCPRCNSPNEKTAKFCIKCGERLPVSDQPEAELTAQTHPSDAHQRQGPVRPQPAVPSKAKSRSKLVSVMLAVILVLLLIVAVELVLFLMGRPEKTPTPGITSSVQATPGTQGASPSPVSAAASSPSATFTPVPPALEPTQPAESQEVQPQSDVPSLVLSARVESFAIAGGRVFVESGDNRIEAFDLKAGESIWMANGTGEILGADPELVYIRPSELRVDALDAGTGELGWRFLSQEAASPISANDNFVLFEGAANLYAVGKSNGNIVSSIPRPDATYWFWSYLYWPWEGQSLAAWGKYGRLSENGQLKGLLLDEDVFILGTCDGILAYTRWDELSGLEAIDTSTGEIAWRSTATGLDSRDKLIVSCGKQNMYLYISPKGKIHAIVKETGDLRWRGLVASLPGYNSSDTAVYRWLGEAEGLVLYSHPGFGMTQAYDVVNHEIVWENPQVVLQRVLGVYEDTLVGVFAGTIVGLDQETGSERWRSEPGSIEASHLMEGRLFYISKGEPEVTFLDPESGAIIAAIPFDRRFDSYHCSSAEGLIVAVGAGTGWSSDSQEQVIIIRP
jgi:outer membrane protein assembly factor BamB